MQASLKGHSTSQLGLNRRTDDQRGMPIVGWLLNARTTAHLNSRECLNRGSSEKAITASISWKGCLCPQAGLNRKAIGLAKKKRSNHLIAVRYVKSKGERLINGGWWELTPLLSKHSGLPIPELGSIKASGISLMRSIGLVDENKKPKRKKGVRNDVNLPSFLESYEWRKLRMKVLKLHGAACQCCGRSRRDGVVIHVDHIKPRRKYPELALVLDNLQVLCHECNHGKGNWDETDWREPRLSVLMGERIGD